MHVARGADDSLPPGLRSMMPPMALPHFLVTGCARSGTGYIATVLTSLGVPCGHERVFCPSHLDGRDELVWPDELPGESSWLAAPYLANLPDDLPVLHQVREPVAFLRSKVRTRFFEVPSWYKSFAERVRPPLLEGSPLERGMRYWLEWNRMVEAAAEEPARRTLRYRLEDVGEPLLEEILETVGVTIDPERVAAALARLPRDYNTRGDRALDAGLGWGDLPAGDLRDEVRDMATRYGYGEPTGEGTLAL